MPSLNYLTTSLLKDHRRKTSECNSSSSSVSNREGGEESKSGRSSEVSTNGHAASTDGGDVALPPPDPLAGTLSGSGPAVVNAGLGHHFHDLSCLSCDLRGNSQKLSSSFSPKDKNEVPQTFYSSGGGTEDDDVTFVDHGSTSMSIFPSSMSAKSTVLADPFNSKVAQQIKSSFSNSGNDHQWSQDFRGQDLPLNGKEKLDHFLLPNFPYSSAQNNGLPHPNSTQVVPVDVLGNKKAIVSGTENGREMGTGGRLVSEQTTSALGLNGGGRAAERSVVRVHSSSSISSFASNDTGGVTAVGSAFVVPSSGHHQTNTNNEPFEGSSQSSSSNPEIAASSPIKPHTCGLQSNSSLVSHLPHPSMGEAGSISHGSSVSLPTPPPQTLELVQPEYDPNTYESPSKVVRGEYGIRPSLEGVEARNEIAQFSPAEAFNGLKSSNTTGGNAAIPSVIWYPPRVVSQLRMDQNVRTMAVSSDGKSVWIAVGDDPLTLLEVDGTNLFVSRSVENITQVYCVAVIKMVRTSLKQFKSMAAASAKESSQHSDETGGRKKDKDISKHTPQEESYFLWCGLNKGHIAIWDLQQQSHAGYIRGAHSTTLHRIWQLPNGNVWTSGLDKAVKVWDPQSRQKLKNRNIAVILADLCYVMVTKEVWGIAADNVIRVYEAGGDNARIKQTGESVIRMKNDLVLIRYCEDANLVWAGMTKGTALIHPTEYDVVCIMNLTITSVAFYAKTAIITGRGPWIESESLDHVAVLDITNPCNPTPMFIGNAMEGVTALGMHLFPANSLALAVQDLGRYHKKSITVFTYKETLPIEKHFLNFAPQDTPRRMNGYFRGLPPPVGSPGAKQTLGYGAIGNTGVPGGLPAAADGLRVPSTGSMSVSPRDGGSDGTFSRSVPVTVDFNGAPLTRAQAALTAPSAMFEFLENIERNTLDTKKALTMLNHGQEPASDVAKLQSNLAQWLLTQPTGALPPLTHEEKEKIDGEYTTSEGKVLASGLVQLQKGLIFARRSLSKYASQEQSTPVDASSSTVNRLSSSHEEAGTATSTVTAVVDSVASHTKKKSKESSKEASSCSMAPTATPAQISTSAGNTESLSGGREMNCDSSPDPSTSGGPSTGIPLELSALLSRLGSADEKKAFQRQVELFQRYNQRLMARQNAFLLGLTRMDQVICSAAQQVQFEGSEKANISETPSFSTTLQNASLQSLQQCVTDTLQQHESKDSLGASSSPLEIRDFFRRTINLLLLILHVKENSLLPNVSFSSPRSSTTPTSSVATVGTNNLSASHKPAVPSMDSKKSVKPSGIAKYQNNVDLSPNSPVEPSGAAASSVVRENQRLPSVGSAAGLEELLHRRLSSQEDDRQSAQSSTEKANVGLLTGSGGGNHYRQSSIMSSSSVSGETSSSNLSSQPLLSTKEGRSLSQNHFLPGEASRLAASILITTPKRLLNRVGEELQQVQVFIDQVSHLEERDAFRRMIYNAYKKGNDTPALEKDDLQILPLIDFKESKLLFYICLAEGYVWLLESLFTPQKGSLPPILEDDSSLAIFRSSPLSGLSPLEEGREEISEKLVENSRFMAHVSKAVDNLSADVRESLIRRKGEKAPEELLTGNRRRSSCFLLPHLSVKGIQLRRHNGALFWGDVSFVLLTECLETVEARFFPSAGSEGNLEEFCPISFANFSRITEQLLEWKNFTLEVEKLVYHFQFVILLCSVESAAVLEANKSMESLRSSSASSHTSGNHKGRSNMPHWPSTQTGSSLLDNLKERKRNEVKKKEDLRILLSRQPLPVASEGDEGVDAAAPEEELQLRFLIILLYIRERTTAILNQAHQSPHQKSQRLLNLFDIDRGRVSEVLQKCSLIKRYVSFLLHRAQELVRDAEKSEDNHGNNVLLIPSAISLQQENNGGEVSSSKENNGLSAAEKSFCKKLAEV